MARIRTIKPEFWTDEDIAMLSEPARLLAIGILNHADDEGYFKAHPMLVKAAVFPLNEPSVSIHELLKELSNAKYIKLTIGSDGKQYGVVRNFLLHQRVNRPNESKIKDLASFSDNSVSDNKQITEGSVLEQGTGNREQGKEQGKDGDEKPSPKRKRFTPPEPDEVQQYMLDYESKKGLSGVVTPFLGERFVNHYQSVDWVAGKKKMSDWKSAARNWVLSNSGKQGQRNKQSNADPQSTANYQEKHSESFERLFGGQDE